MAVQADYFFSETYNAFYQVKSVRGIYMIHLWPYLEEQIDSGKTPGDIRMILQSVTDSRKIDFSADAEFFGQIYPLGFRITPRLNYRNSFVPLLTGIMIEKEEGTAIKVTLQMHILTRAFLAVWNGLACFFFLCAILALFAGGPEQISIMIVSVGLLLFGQVFPRCGFYGPAKKALERLKELLC